MRKITLVDLSLLFAHPFLFSLKVLIPCGVGDGRFVSNPTEDLFREDFGGFGADPSYLSTVLLSFSRKWWECPRSST